MLKREEPPRQRVLALLKKYGWNATSFQLLEPDFSYWFGDDSCVGFVTTRFAAVAAGAPVAAHEEVGNAAADFVAAARARRRRACFFAVEQRLLDATALDSVIVGEQPWWNPQQWSERRRAHRSIREQLRRARAKGVRVERWAREELEAEGSPHREAVNRLIARWSTTRPMPPMQFLVALDPFTFAAERLYFAAMQGMKLVGLLVAVPVYQRNGWFLEDLLRDPSAPNGTAETLVDAAMNELATRGCDYATLGLVPLSHDAPWLRLSRRALSGFYNFEGLRAFKAKLAPDGWEPIHLAYPRGASPLLALYDVLDAFSRGRLFRFALRAVFRASPFTLRMLGWLLVPWTALLLVVPAERWFPNSAVQLAWGAFDIAMAIGLLRQARHWHQRAGEILAGAALLDFALTAVQTLVWNLPHRRGAGDLLVIGLSLAAPLAAAGILSGGVRRHRLAAAAGAPSVPAPSRETTAGASAGSD